jgi:hypothetical protein
MGWLSRDWCCGLFRDSFDSRALCTHFIFASPPVPRLRSTYSFWLAFRSVAREQLAGMHPESVAPPDVKVVLSSCQAIFFCPWCGRNLAGYYGQSASRLVDAELCSEFMQRME